MTPLNESDYPPGHPARFDYDPETPEAQEWLRANYSPQGERDWPRGHPKACDTPGNKNTVPVRAGVDPNNPQLEPFTGRTPAQVKALKVVRDALTRNAEESKPRTPGIAPDPPKPLAPGVPLGQPGA